MKNFVIVCTSLDINSVAQGKIPRIPRSLYKKGPKHYITSYQSVLGISGILENDINNLFSYIYLAPLALPRVL